jgi:hypothetical protein
VWSLRAVEWPHTALHHTMALLAKPCCSLSAAGGHSAPTCRISQPALWAAISHSAIYGALGFNVLSYDGPHFRDSDSMVKLFVFQPLTCRIIFQVFQDGIFSALSGTDKTSDKYFRRNMDANLWGFPFGN